MSGVDYPHPSQVHGDLIEHFLNRFPTGGLPSERTMVRLFINQYVRETGALPSGTLPLRVSYRGETVIGKAVDFSPLSMHMPQQQAPLL